jgi:Bacterial SH3 domain
MSLGTADGDADREDAMIEAFVIAFIHCNGQSCVISYLRPGEVYLSYNECKAQLPETPAGKGFDVRTFEGSEIACIEVLAHAAADEWVALETSNLRKSPSADSDVIATVKRGASFQVLGQERKWLSVQMVDGTRGFLWRDRAKKIHSSFLAAEQSADPARPPKEKPRPVGTKVPESEASPGDLSQEGEPPLTRTATKPN